MQGLVEKYRPKRISDFAGLKAPKRIVADLVHEPRPTALLFVGPPGVGKTTLGQALARELNAALILVKSRELDASTVERVWSDVHYYPPDGKTWWVVLVNEADTMSRAAQNALLSHLDGDANYGLEFGGASREREPLPIIWIFTCNGCGPDGCHPPHTLDARFIQRCRTVPFKCLNGELRPWALQIWHKEGGNGQPDFVADKFESMLSDSDGSPRDVLQRMETLLLESDDWEPDALESLAPKTEAVGLPEREDQWSAPRFALTAPATGSGTFRDGFEAAFQARMAKTVVK